MKVQRGFNKRRRRGGLALLLAALFSCLHLGLPLLHHHTFLQALASSANGGDSDGCALCELTDLCAVTPPATVSLSSQSLLVVDVPIWVVTLAAPRHIAVRTAARAPPA